MKLVAFAFAFSALATAFAAPEVTISSAAKQTDGTYKIDYALTGGPAIITADVITNGVAMGGVCGFAGDVHKKITGDGDHTAVWDPKVAELPALGSLRFSIKAWELNSPPDYLVVDLQSSSDLRCQYYLSEKAIPGGLLANAVYRTTALVMRRIHAAGITWKMGDSGGDGPIAYPNEKPHNVTLPRDYYIGVFPITQGQWKCVKGVDNDGERPAYSYPGYRWMRPMQNIRASYIREGALSMTEQYDGSRYPNPPGPNGFIGILNARSGLDFDLPGEAQWEYACRAGNDNKHWGNGAPIVRSEWYDETGYKWVGDHNLPGRYASNGGSGNGIYAEDWTSVATRTPKVGSPIVGSYQPNAWGIYDMHGCIKEFCLDWYQEDISHLTEGQVNANLRKFADGTDVPDATDLGNPLRVVRGGGYAGSWAQCRAAYRASVAYRDLESNGEIGFRVICYHGLDTWTPPADGGK